jgi:hypothetical protein
MWRKIRTASCLAQNITDFHKSCYLSVDVAAILKRHLLSSKITISVNVTCASRRKHRADQQATYQSADLMKRDWRFFI